MNRFLHTIGDKHAAATVRQLAQNPETLDALRERVELPLRMINFVCNPYDNVAAMALQGMRMVEESARRYVTTINAIQKIRPLFADEEWMDLRYDLLLARPRETMTRVCNFLQLEPLPEYLELCEKLLVKPATRARDGVIWDGVSQFRMRQIIEQTPFLSTYTFEK